MNVSKGWPKKATLQRQGWFALKKTLVTFFILTSLLSCGKKSEANNSKNAFIEEQNEDSLKPVARFDVNALTFGFSRSQEDKIQQASSLIRRIIASEEFKHKVLNYTFQGKKQFHDNDGLTNKQIYQKILNGSEKMTGLGKNSTMDLELELYTDNESNTIGYTYPNIVRVYMNRKYFNKFRPYEVADNMMHEWLHKLGFDHAVKVTPERRHSVPYAIGYIVKAMAKKLP